MIRVLLILLLVTMLNAELNTNIENSNFIIIDDTTHNYDRLRMRVDYKEGTIFGTVIADVVNFVGDEYLKSPTHLSSQLLKSDTPFDIQTNRHSYSGGEVYMKLHRAYIGYADETNRITLGLQNIQIGKGTKLGYGCRASDNSRVFHHHDQ